VLNLTGRAFNHHWLIANVSYCWVVRKPAGSIRVVNRCGQLRNVCVRWRRNQFDDQKRFKAEFIGDFATGWPGNCRVTFLGVA
jgi:hypothetical protein